MWKIGEDGVSRISALKNRKGGDSNWRITRGWEKGPERGEAPLQTLEPEGSVHSEKPRKAPRDGHWAKVGTSPTV